MELVPQRLPRFISTVQVRAGAPKGDGRTRPLGIPTVKSLPRAKAGDRIVQTALKMVIEPIPRVRPLAGPRTCFETQFRPGSYGFRPGRGCKSLPSRKRGMRCGKSTGC
jgi:retron-type reverse transcriptase